MAGLGNYMSFGNQRAIAAQRTGDGSYSLLFGLPLSERSEIKSDLVKRPRELRDWLVREAYQDWAEVNSDIETYSDAGFGVWRLYGLPKDALSWDTVPEIALIGDAAHLT